METNMTNNTIEEIQLLNENDKLIDENLLDEQMKEDMYEHSSWLHMKSEEEFMKHYRKGHTIKMNTAKYVNNDLLMACAECQSCGFVWNVYYYDKIVSASEYKVPQNGNMLLKNSHSHLLNFSDLDINHHHQNHHQNHHQTYQPYHQNHRETHYQKESTSGRTNKKNEQGFKVKII